MSVERELAHIHARQATRAARAAIVVLVGGGIGTLSAAILSGMGAPRDHETPAFLATAGFGTALTAVLYALTCALQAHGEDRAARHLATALDAEAADGS